jgi:radical SAM superfamily enzyme YgiQ (UPF0313 family)
MQVVLTASPALLSDYNGTSYMGFASALPASLIKEPIARRLFPTRSDREGRVKFSNYALAKVEAKLLEEFDRDEVVISDPRKLSKTVTQDTKAVGVTCMDPLGLSYGSGIVYMTLKLFGYEAKGTSYMSKAFTDLLNDRSIKRYKPKIILGGPAAWQITDNNAQEALSIDSVVLGEGEKVVKQLFRDAVDGRELPKTIEAPNADVEDIAPIRTPSLGGTVEITRGCGRGCKFCTPTMIRFKSLPAELIEEEVGVNVEHGAERVTLHSEDFLRYGSRGIKPEGEKVAELFERISKIPKGLGTDFASASSVACEPELTERIGKEYVNREGRSFIELGIETGSPELIQQIMPGKVYPFRAEEYPDVVTKAIETLNDGGWTVVGTMITGLPEEKESDTIKSLELLDRLKDMDVIVFVLPFIPMGMLRGNESKAIDMLMDDGNRRELLIRGLEKSMRQLNKDINVVRNGITKSLFARLALGLAVDYGLKKMESVAARNDN